MLADCFRGLAKIRGLLAPRDLRLGLGPRHAEAIKAHPFFQVAIFPDSLLVLSSSLVPFFSRFLLLFRFSLLFSSFSLLTA